MPSSLTTEEAHGYPYSAVSKYIRISSPQITNHVLGAAASKSKAADLDQAASEGSV